MKQADTPISERVAAHEGIDPTLVREIRMMEKTATGRIVHGAANGRSPRDWSPERWILVIGFIGTFLYQVFGLGVSFSTISRDVRIATDVVNSVKVDLQQHIYTHEQEHAAIRERIAREEGDGGVGVAAAERQPSATRRRQPTYIWPTRPSTRPPNANDDQPSFPRDERFPSTGEE